MFVYSIPKALTLISLNKVTVLNGVYGIKLKFKVDWKSTAKELGITVSYQRHFLV